MYKKQSEENITEESITGYSADTLRGILSFRWILFRRRIFNTKFLSSFVSHRWSYFIISFFFQIHVSCGKMFFYYTLPLFIHSAHASSSQAFFNAECFLTTMKNGHVSPAVTNRKSTEILLQIVEKCFSSSDGICTRNFEQSDETAILWYWNRLMTFPFG